MSIQQQIVKGIKSLLHRHDYLVLPDFGGFVLKAGPSHYSASGLQLLPPFKTVTFNSRLRQNDSVLATWLQEQLGCSASEALEHLRDFSAYCQALLHTRRRLNLDGIGFFFLDLEGNMGFEPQSDVNFLTESFGLGPVQAGLLETKKEVKDHLSFTDRAIFIPAATPTIPSTVRKRLPVRRLLLPAFGTLAIFGLLILFVSNNRISGQLKASLFGDTRPGSYDPLSYPDLPLSSGSAQAMAYVADANGIATVDLGNKLVAVRAVETDDASGLTSAPASHHFRSGSFEIVLGCFTVSENAKRLAGRISANKGIPTRVSERNEKGMYVVSTGAYATKDDAIEALAAIKQSYPKAWIK